MNFSNLNNDEIFSIAMRLDLIGLLDFCNSSKRVNEVVCKKDHIWEYRIKQDFPEYDGFLPKSNTKTTYIKLYKLEKLINSLYSNDEDKPVTMKQIYMLKRSNLSRMNITKIPKEIDVLENMEWLFLNDNNIVEIPKEIGNMKNLEVLKLQNNQIKELPKELGKLKNLYLLDLGNNNIKYIPEEIEKLNIKDLFLDNNPVEK